MKTIFDYPGILTMFIIAIAAIMLFSCGDENETLDIDSCDLISLKIDGDERTEWICNTKHKEEVTENENLHRE